MFDPNNRTEPGFVTATTEMSPSWTVEETNLLIHKRLELFNCSRSDKVYDQISVFLSKEHNYYKNAAACQTRFNNLLKTYRMCVKRIESGGFVCKIRFPYFDTFHEYYGKLIKMGGPAALAGGAGDNAGGTGGKCKSEIFLDEIFEDSSYADGRVAAVASVTGRVIGSGIDALLMDSMQTDDCDAGHYGNSPQSQHRLHLPGAHQSGVVEGDEELTTSLTATNGLEDLKLRLMEQKLLYYTNQNMLLQMKQEHYRQKEQDRARSQLMSEEILRVLKGIHSCLKKTAEIRVSTTTTAARKEEPPRKEPKEAKPPEPEPQPEQPEVLEPFSPEDPKEHDEQLLEEEEAEEEEEPEALQQFLESDEDDDEDVEENGMMDVQSNSSTELGGSDKQPQQQPQKQVGRLKVRKNIFPPWNRIQTVLLIKIHCDLRPKFAGYNLFECVSNKLIELHINRTPRDCRTRWNNLFRSYKECRMRLRLNDKASVKFEYFDEIDAYFKDKEFST